LGVPVSAAIYVNKVEDVESLVRFISSHRREFQNMALHILLETRTYGYLHNTLHNLALDSAVTEYVLPMDADFITDHGAYDKMLNLIKHDADGHQKLQ
jgi:hypothetical protein